MACNQCRSESYINYDTNLMSYMLCPQRSSSAPGQLLRYMCTCDCEEIEWSYSEEFSFKSRLTN